MRCPSRRIWPSGSMRCAPLYLIFNEGYAASHGDNLLRADLCAEAIRLGRLLIALLPNPIRGRGVAGADAAAALAARRPHRCDG